MLLDYKELKKEFEQIKKNEKKAKSCGRKLIVIANSKIDLEEIDELSLEDEKKQEHWRYILSQKS